MAVRLRFEVGAPKLAGVAPKLKRKLRAEVFKEIKDDYGDLYRAQNTRNTSPSGGRLIKSRRVHRNTKPHGVKKSNHLVLNTALTGGNNVVGFILMQEFGTRGKGGRYPTIKPKKSKVLTLPNQRGGVAQRARARQFPNATWIPGRTPGTAVLAILEPPKRSVGPNHKQPRQFMRPSRKVERIVMTGVPKVDLRPKEFIKDNSMHSFAGIRKTAPFIIGRIFREALK